MASGGRDAPSAAAGGIRNQEFQRSCGPLSIAVGGLPRKPVDDRRRRGRARRATNSGDCLMNTKKLHVSLVLLSSLLAACSVDCAAQSPASAAAAKAAASPDSAELAAFKKAIRARYAIKEKAFAAHDAETIVTRF